MFMYPPGVQLLIYKQHEEELLKQINQFQAAKSASYRSNTSASGIVQFLKGKLFHSHAMKDACADC